MAELQKDTLTVEFSGPDAERELKFEEDERSHDFNQRFIRLYPSGVTLVFSTSGTLVRQGTIRHDETEVLLFNGQNNVTLTYPMAVNVGQVRLLNKFFDKDGNQAVPTFTFDATRNRIMSTVAGFGAVEVSYSSWYSLFDFRFSGGPCPIPAPEESPYDQATIVAISNTKDSSAALHLDGPSCKQATFSLPRGQEAEPPRLRLEIDPYGPPRFGIGGREPSADCYVRLYPNVNVIIDTNSGTLNPTGDTGQQPVQELLRFTGNASVNLRYHPINNPQIVREGNFVDNWGTNFSPRFHGPGSRVTEVEWLGSNLYRNPVQRTVGDDEIVVTDSSDRTRPGHGIARAVYAASYKRYYYQFHWDDLKNRFTTGYLTARANEKPANLQIDPPTVEAA